MSLIHTFTDTKYHYKITYSSICIIRIKRYQLFPDCLYDEVIGKLKNTTASELVA